jgi:hypothetical protein
MSKRQNQRQALVGANRAIAEATAQTARLRTQIRSWRATVLIAVQGVTR